MVNFVDRPRLRQTGHPAISFLLFGKRPKNALALHIFYVALGLIIGSLFTPERQARSAFQYLSLLTANASLVLLCLTLLYGPHLVFRGASPVTSARNRRHLGVWSGIFALLHVAFGLNVHMGGHFAAYFVNPSTPGQPISLRLDVFGSANDIGLLAMLTLAVLMGISNNASLRFLKPKKWKWIQRLVYPAAAAIFIHAMLYQFMERRAIVSVLAVVLLTTIVATYQIAGMVRTRLRLVRKPTEISGINN